MAAPDSVRTEDRFDYGAPEDWMSEKEYWQEMKARDEETPPPCYRCGAELDEDAVDHSYRIGDTEKVVKQWACAACDEEIHDEAMAQIP